VNWVRESAPVHILAAERAKLACKRQGERIFAKGEYLGTLVVPFFLETLQSTIEKTVFAPRFFLFKCS
jgi:hypothetical protein